MKHILSLLLLSLIVLFSAPPAQARSYSVNYNDVPIEKVISDLQKQTGYEFVYQKDVIVGIPKISASYKSMTLQQILNRLFVEDLNIDYEIVDKTVILSRSSKELPFYKRQISGMVVDQNNEPVIGASVFLENSKIGTATDLDGQFTILTEDRNPKLRVTYVSMKPKTVQLGPKDKSVIITLEEDTQLMSEVIVTGYSNFKRENATGSYQSISAKDLDQRHVGSITENLEGKIPGLVTYDNGNGKGKQMTIRGTGSFNAATNPLVVVDGLPIEGSIETVNPYDIENITVLKDAAAAAIYGARASNGVIVITTKKGKDPNLTVEVNADVTVYERNNYDYLGYATASEMVDIETYNFNYMLKSPNRSPYNSLLNYYNSGREHAISPATLLLLRNSLGVISDSELAESLGRLRSNDYLGQWQDIVETPKVEQQYNIAIRNSGEKLSSNITLNYARDNNSRHDEYASDLMFSYSGIWNVFKGFRVNFGINLLSERGKNHILNTTWGAGWAFLPYYSAYDGNGNLNPMQADVNLNIPTLNDPALGLKPVSFNPVTDFGTSMLKERRTNIRSYVNANYTILPGWDVSAQFQYEDIYYKGDSYYSADSYRMRLMYNSYTSLDKATGAVTHHIPDGGMLNTATSQGSYYTFRAQTSYENTIADRHDINAVAGFEFREQRTSTYGNVLLGYDDQTQTNSNAMVNWGMLKQLDGTASAMGADYTMNGAPENESFTTGDILHRFYSIYFTGNYVYDSRYTLTGSWRLDKCDLFGADPKFRGRPLWSVGLSWNIHNEAFMHDISWIDALKIRASYGLTGNIANNVSSYLTGTIGVNDLYGKKYVTLDTPPNDQLRWEKTATWNAGLDFALWGSRLTGSVDFYSKHGSDLLSVTDLDPTTGWTQLTINNGKVRNTGVELQLNGEIIRAYDPLGLSLSLGLSFAYNHNKVTKVSHQPTTGIEALSPTTLHEGYPVNSLFSYDFAGMVNEGEMQYYSWRDSKGNVHTSDINNEEFTVNDIVYSGSLDPRFIGSLLPTIKYYGFSLSAMLSYYGGHVMRVDCDNWTSDGSVYGYGSLSVIDGVPSAYLNYWRDGADKYPANGALGGSHVIGSGLYGSQNVAPADYLKVRNIVLGYNFNDRVCKALHMKDLRLRFQINNLATWARNKQGVDPEANNAINGSRSLKTPRSYTFSIFFSF